MGNVEVSDADYLHDVFLAHATADNRACLNLHDALERAGVHVFMDVKRLDAAAEWDLEIPEHQRQSRLTLVFVSKNTSAAWFQRAEIVRAINQRRFGDRPHSIVPIWGAGQEKPYGLEMLTGLPWEDSEAGVAAVVEGTLEVLKKSCGVVVADRFHASGLPDFLTTGLHARRCEDVDPDWRSPPCSGRWHLDHAGSATRTPAFRTPETDWCASTKGTPRLRRAGWATRSEREHCR